MKHRRVFCGECKREWIQPSHISNSSAITITGNKRDDLCPICGSSQIELVEYEPPFLGGDIPRPEEKIDIPSLADLGENETERESIDYLKRGYTQNALVLSSDGESSNGESK